jgi:hypothetical protein
MHFANFIMIWFSAARGVPVYCYLYKYHCAFWLLARDEENYWTTNLLGWQKSINLSSAYGQLMSLFYNAVLRSLLWTLCPAPARRLVHLLLFFFFLKENRRGGSLLCFYLKKKTRVRQQQRTKQEKNTRHYNCFTSIQVLRLSTKSWFNLNLSQFNSYASRNLHLSNVRAMFSKT